MRILLIKQDQTPLDITSMVGVKTWMGSKNEAARKLKFTFLIGNIDIDIMDNIILLSDNDIELFQGIVLVRTRNKNNIRNIEVYDQLFYWANNKDVFDYNNRTLSFIVNDICDRFEIPKGTITPVDYPIPSLPMKPLYLYDYFKLAASQTYKNTGERYYLRSRNGKVDLIKRRNQVQQWVVEPGVNMMDFDFSESGRSTKTRIRVSSKSGDFSNIVTVDGDLISQLGILQEYKSLDANLNSAQLRQRAEVLSRELGKIDRVFTIQALGIDEVITGDAIFINIPDANLVKAYYIESDRHSIINNEHTMTLSLLETNEIT